MAVHKSVSCGADLHFATDLSEAIISAGNAGYKFIAVDISHPRYRQELLDPNPKSKPTPFARSDLVLPSQDWSSLVVLKVSQWIDVDSPNETTRKMSEKVLERELCYAAHVGVPAIIINRERDPTASTWPDSLHNLPPSLHILPVDVPCVDSVADGMARHSKCPLRLPGLGRHRRQGGRAGGHGRADGGRGTLGMVEHLPEHLRHGQAPRGGSAAVGGPPERAAGAALAGGARALPAGAHLPLHDQQEGLPRAAQATPGGSSCVFLKLECQVLVEGSCHHEHMKLYYQYIDHLYNTQPPDDPLAEFAKGFEDHLQTPLQPLMDNLESVTYEVFEKDPVKYTEYQRAMYLALMDKGEVVGESTEITLMVVGAGRGPLVRAALSAAELAHQRVKVYAIEKNPNAVLTLLSQKEEVWQDRVTVVSCDMREFEAPEKADILVSELLGSFGDNELSPECLDGA
uniref:Protein arginine N-methyltransferase 5 n=1 Tax=Ixodes ricinus TaxID=34613 RepID=A0A090XB37_IXORI